MTSRIKRVIFGTLYIFCWIFIGILSSCNRPAILAFLPMRDTCIKKQSVRQTSLLPLIAASHARNVQIPTAPKGTSKITRERIEAALLGHIPKPITPLLTVREDKIVRADNGETVILKGAISDAFRKDEYVPPIGDILKNFELVRSFGANMIGLYIQPEPIYNHIESLDLVIKWASENGIYVYFMPVLNVAKTGPHSAFDRSYDTLMQFLALRYISQTNILYGIGAEPYITTPEPWLARTLEIANGIRKNNPTAPLLITGYKIGRSFDHLSLAQFPYENSILFIEYYPKESSESSALIPPLLDDAVPKTLHMPYIMGEFGGVWKNGFGSNVDIDTIQEVIDYANSHAVGYSLFRIEPFSENYDGLSELSIQTVSGSMTRRGQLLINDLYEHPPTFIEK